MGLIDLLKSWFGKDKPVDIIPKNKIFQSCLYCFEGPAQYRLDLDNGDIAYVCERHRLENHSDLIVGSVSEKEFPNLS